MVLKQQPAVEHDFFTVLVRKEEEFFAGFVRINGCTSGLPSAKDELHSAKNEIGKNQQAPIIFLL